MVSVELSPGTGPSYQVEDLLETVRSQLGIGEEIQQRTTSGYPLAAARWMLRHMMASQGQWLLVLDGFGQAGLHDEVGETIKALAVLVPSGTFRDKIKLILLDYPDTLPGHIQDEVLEEVLPLAADIVSADLKPCLAAWNAGRVRQGKRQLAAEDLARLADGILGQVPLAGKQRLVMLNKKLTELHQFP
jgi:hypothetical protein